jgi:hypothetical protein
LRRSERAEPVARITGLSLEPRDLQLLQILRERSLLAVLPDPRDELLQLSDV